MKYLKVELIVSDMETAQQIVKNAGVVPEIKAMVIGDFIGPELPEPIICEECQIRVNDLEKHDTEVHPIIEPEPEPEAEPEAKPEE